MHIKTATLLLTVQTAICVDLCHTPAHQHGDCKPILDCPQIYSHFQGRYSNNIATYLRQSQCGSFGIYSKVCCPLDFENPPLLPKTTECGRTTSLKMFEGNITDIDEFPWLARLKYNTMNGIRSFKCGGFLISKRYVLTARHCLGDTLISVRLGEWNATSDLDCVRTKMAAGCAPEAFDVPIEEQVPYRDETATKNDIALIRLGRDVEYNDFVRPVCLPIAPDDINMSYFGKKLTVAGWGTTEAGVSSGVKLKTLVTVRPLSFCVNGLSEILDPDVRLHDRQICAGGEEEKGSSFGDSGGPLMLNRNEKWYAVGIASFGPKSSQNGKPSVYVKVTKYVRWITDNVKS